jgi:GTP-binding protein
MFYDEATIKIASGAGGRGCVSFRREIYVPKGGPDGGDGGRGGDVVFIADDSVSSLYDLAHTPLLRAKNGGIGMGAKCTGASGEDLVIKVPPGTVVKKAGTEEIIADLTKPGDSIVIAKGGKGGYGNKHFATSTNQTPREYEEGRPGVELELYLELKLIADVGLVGLPNAGKSTLLSRISAARPRIAAFPFTTKQPYLGIAELSDYRRLVFADLPGLIEGAHMGTGLGIEFLRHIERTRIIVHLIDITAPDTGDVKKSYETIRNELASYSAALASKPEIVVLSKGDLAQGEARSDALKAFGRSAHVISAATGEGLPELLELAWRIFHENRPE